MRPILRSTCIAAVVMATAAFATMASLPTAAPGASLATKQAQARELDAQVRKLELRYDDLQERYRGAEYELDRIRREVEQAHVVVLATRRDLRSAKSRLALRASAIYRSGSDSDLAELAGSGSISDFFDRIDTRRRIGEQDATVLDRVEALNAKVERKERILRTAKRRADAATRKARAAKERMEGILAERQAKLDSVNADIRSIMEAQRRAAEARAARAARKSRSLADTSEASSGSSSSGSSSGGSSIPLPPGSGAAASAANYAMGKLGSPYVWAGSGPDTFDCSGLVMWAFGQVGISLPHSSYALAGMGVDVPLDQLQVGDLVFPSHNGHVGIYVGGGSFVHAPSSGDVVKVTSMSYYSIAHARRI
jgi:cell wall-associated NlpC family hydrolase